jgi:hypothetical protein
VILHDPAPGALQVVLSVNMPGDGADRGNTMIGLSFLSQGKAVQLVGNVQLVCNGKTLPVHQQYALFQLADAPSTTLEGQAMRCCTYRVGNASTTFSFVVPRAPVIRSPQNGAQISRSTQTIVTYDDDAQAGKLSGMVALGPDAKTVTNQLNTPGPMQATLDTSTFLRGEGLLSLSQALTPKVTQTGTPFQSLTAQGTANAVVTVIRVRTS